MVLAQLLSRLPVQPIGWLASQNSKPALPAGLLSRHVSRPQAGSKPSLLCLTQRYAKLSIDRASKTDS